MRLVIWFVFLVISIFGVQSGLILIGAGGDMAILGGVTTITMVILVWGLVIASWLPDRQDWDKEN